MASFGDVVYLLNGAIECRGQKAACFPNYSGRGSETVACIYRPYMRPGISSVSALQVGTVGKFGKIWIGCLLGWKTDVGQV